MARSHDRRSRNQVFGFIDDFVGKVSEAASSDYERWQQYGNSNMAQARNSYVNKLHAKVQWLDNQWRGTDIVQTYFICGAMDSFTNFLRGLNRAIIPMIISIFWACIFRLIWNFFIYSSDPTSIMHSTLILYTCYPVSWFASLTCQIIYYFVERKKIYREIEKNKISFQNAQ